MCACLVVQSCPPLCDPTCCAARFLCPWGFSRQEYWSGLPCLPPGDLPHPGIKPVSPIASILRASLALPGFSEVCNTRMLSRISCVWVFGILCIVAHQAPLSMGFSKKEYWSGLPCLLPGDLPDPGIKPASLMSPALAVRFYTTSATWEAPIHICIVLIMYLLQILWVLIFILDVVHFLSFPWPSSKIVKRIQLKLKEWAAKKTQQTMTK